MLAICHTYYSLRTGVRSPKDWAEAAAARGYSALAVADINGLYGAVEFFKEADKAGLQPIVGSQIHVDAHLGFMAFVASGQGYRQLCRLLSRLHLDERFVLEDALSESGFDGLLFVVRSGHAWQRLRRIVAPANLYRLPCTPVRDRDARTLWDTVAAGGRRLPVPDAWFIEEGDRVPFDSLARLRALSGDSVAEALRGVRHPGVRLPRVEQWNSAGIDLEAVADFCRRCTFRFEFGTPLLPELKLPAGADCAIRLRDRCSTELELHYSAKLRRRARLRLSNELATICRNGFADYFLCVDEIVRFAQSRRIPVEVRGSAASSIVSYLLGFTHCCPLDHDLYFERFMNPGRRDCPDIDVDIADNRRDEAIRFCYDRWGADRVAMVATVLTYRTRSAVRDAGRLLGYSPAFVSRLLDDGSDCDACSKLFRVAAPLVGLPRHLGVHCGGLVITPVPLTDLTPLTRARKGVVITHYEKDQAEAIGLVKMDILGNSALSVIDESQRQVRDAGGEFTESGPRFDYKVNRLFAAGDTLGVYQCESPGMRQLCRALEPTTPKEVSATLSLIRPGPAAAGMKDAFIRRRRGVESVTYLHPAMADFLASTYGVMLYQEDVMKVAVNLAGYTLAESDHLRRAVKESNSRGFAEERDRFIFEKAASAGVDETVAGDIWRQVTQFASYSYCKAHASVYGRLAWLTARLKAHYPREFFTAILRHHKSMYPKRVFVWDAIRHGIPVFGPDVNLSEIQWSCGQHGIRAGLDVIGGLRYSLCRQIVNQRRRRPFDSVWDLQERVTFHSGELQRLVLCGACRAFGSREALLREVRNSGCGNRQPVLFSVADEPCLPTLMESELRICGISFSAHPVQSDWPRTCPARELSGQVGRDVDMVGILDAVKCVRTGPAQRGAAGREMSFVTLEDVSGLFELVLFPDVHQRYGQLFKAIGPYRVHGRVTDQWGSCVLQVRSVQRVSGPLCPSDHGGTVAGFPCVIR